MSADAKNKGVLLGLTCGFLLLAAGFFIEGSPEPATGTPPRSPSPKGGTVRISAAQLIKNGGDTSVLDCYTCHDEKKPVELKFTEDRRLILPKEHADLIISMRNCETCHSPAKPVKLEYAADGAVIMPAAHQNLLEMSHGRNNRNNLCFNCHNPAKLNELVTRDGTKLTLDHATPLCASCHGPTYRDWEAGVHGRTTGHWNRAMGEITREDCTSCHDPHAPAFPQLIPLRRPQPLHAVIAADHTETAH
jgi:predicted CXXCH cytochrome family protein